jgi:hypothetical protein
MPRGVTGCAVWVIGFLSGFSERFSQDFIVGAESKLAGPLSAKTETATPGNHP